MKHFKKLYFLLDNKAKRRLLLLALFSVCISIIEVVGISAIMPFIDIATDFNTIQENKYYQYFFALFSFENESNFAVFFGLILIGFYVIRGGLNWLYSYLVSHFSQDLYAQITKRLFRVYLAMPYQDFVGKNSSYLTKAIITEASLMSSSISAGLLMISEILVIVFLYILMLIASWKVTLVFTIILLIKILFLTRTISRKIKTIGEMRATTQQVFYEVINRIFGNFKYIKLQSKGRLSAIENSFSTEVEVYAKLNAKHAFLIAFPRLFLETSGFVLIIFSLVVLLYSSQSDVSHTLPVLSLFILALYRLLPSVNRIVSGYNTLMYHHKSIDIIKEELDTCQENLTDSLIEFNQEIKLKDIIFSYRDKVVLNKVSLAFRKGDKIAFTGESGAGKSTLVDLIIGLHQADSGLMTIDGIPVEGFNVQSWRSQVGYIPQQVYLFDGTILENVCFGRELDNELLEVVLKQANIFTFLQSKQGVNTLVGEGGVQLSGGQKQRIAIARALYGKPEVLVLDEATSSLDDETELKIMNEIYRISKNKTLIIIAHRLSTTKGCNRVFKMQDGIIMEQ